MKNTGIILQQSANSDYKFGSYNENIKKVLSSNRDYTSYLPENEQQHSVYFDSMSCVSFSACNCLEIIFNFYLKNDLFSPEDKNWLVDNGYVVNNKINFSDRYIAKLSNTTKNGNTGRKVAEAIRKYGVIPEAKWNYPIKQRTPVFDWDNYFKKIPQELLDLGKEFKKRFLIKYEIVNRDNFKNALIFGPIQVFVYAWKKNKQELYYRPNNKKINHAVVNIKENQILDSYNPFIKELTSDINNYYYNGYLYILKYNNMKLIKEAGNPTIYWVDALGKKRAFYDETHFKSVAPILGLAKENEMPDWSQVKTISKEELESYPLGRPLFLIQ